MAQFRSCDFWLDFHTGYGIPGYDGTAAFNMKKTKNDSGHRGQLAAVGKSKNPQLDLVQPLKYWIFSMGLSTHPLCQKRSYPARHCSLCNLSFSCPTIALSQHYSLQQISDGVKSAKLLPQAIVMLSQGLRYGYLQVPSPSGLKAFHAPRALVTRLQVRASARRGLLAEPAVTRTRSP